jgi:GT2 family glycosyltransferase
MPEELVPPVVAVVVTSDPGAWFESCLGSLGAQDYPNLALLVVDNGSRSDVMSRVAAVEPSAVVRRLEEPLGYGAAANEALVGVEGVTWFLLCHDDIELAPETVSDLVAEALRMNAGIVGPKLVEADRPDRLSHVGLGMRWLGRPVDRVEPGELDQSQHDEVREVFAVSGACLLARADLFEALGGYDAAISFFGEDIDLCWRAQIAGARVVVAPTARVLHREATTTGERPMADVLGLVRRHQIRAVLKNYSWPRRLLAAAELLLRAVVKSIAPVMGRPRDEGRLERAAWRWNLANRSSLTDARRKLHELRQVPDRELARRMEHRVRLSALLRQEGHRPAGRHVLHLRQRRPVAPPVQVIVTACLIGVAGLIGVRNLLFARSPLIGQLVRMHPASTLVAQYLGGRPTGAGIQPAPPGYLLVGLFGLLLGNSSALAWKLVEFGALALGIVGVARALRPLGPSRARIIGASVVFLLPFGWNALATGNVEAAVAFGGAPWVLARLTRAAGADARRSSSAEAVPSAGADGAHSAGGQARLAGLAGQIVPLGLLLALLIGLAPAFLIGAVAIAIGLAIAGLFCGNAAGAGRILLVASGALVLAFVCLLPWSAGFFSGGDSWSALTGGVPATGTTPASLLRGHLGPIGAWWGAWGLVVASGYALLVTRGERFRAAIGWWFAALASVAAAWAGSEGWLGSGGGASAVIAGSAAAAIAGLCGLGAAGFEVDVTRAAIGWRHATAAAAGLFAVAGALPALGVLVGGHAGLPASGFDATLSWPGRTSAPYSVLWVGDPRALPGSGWELERGLSWYTTSTGFAGSSQLWPTASPGGQHAVADALRSAELGRTADVGRLLGRAGVRFVVVPSANAPRLPGTQSPSLVAPPLSLLVEALANQADLVQQPVEAGAAVFRNADWSAGSSRAALIRSSASGSVSPAWRGLGLVLAIAVTVLMVGEGVVRRRRTGPAEDREDDDPPNGEASRRDDGVVEALWEPESSGL